MASLVAPKPSDGPTSPGLMSFGSDPSALDDYLNLDLFGVRTSHSPASSHSALPMTPGSAPAESSTAPFPALDQSPGSSLSFVDSYTPLDKTFGAFPDLPGLGGTDLAINGGLDQYNSLFQDMFPTFSEPAPGPSAPVIDPQLFTALPPAPAAEPPPAPPPAPASVGAESDSDCDEEEDDVAPLLTRITVRRPKKSAAAAGGIAKRPSRASTPTSVVPSYLNFEDPKPVVPPALGKGGVASYLNGERIGSQEPDEWRPTPEEYKKLSSKEKRQLRNKISARNFRVRRKEYITTLESHIADRDQLISAIRSELSLTHNENNELRREIDALKRAIQEGRLSAEATGLPPPRPLTPEGQPSTSTSTTTRRPTDLARANTQKDRSNDPNARSFWGGAVGHGGVTSVHTTLIPEMFPAGQQLSGKPSPVRNLSPQSTSPMSSGSPATPPNEGVNMNPLMNLSPLFGSSKLPTSPPVHVGLDIMDQAFDQRTLDGFRAQLWGRMAKEAGARSVQLERRVPEGSEGSASPAQASTLSSSQQSVSPQQSSTSSPPQPTISSSPSLSMLNSPSTFRSMVESITGRPFEDRYSLFISPAQPAPAPAPAPSTPAPALLQASSFGAGFLGSTSSTGSVPATSAFAQNAASIQARAMLQAQWLALQQSRQVQNTAAGSSSPAQASSPSAAQREAYLAHFAQAAAAHQQQLQLQQQQPVLAGRAGDVRPAYFATSSTKPPAKASDKKLVSALEKMSLGDKKADKGTTPQQAAFVATLASQTLLQRMGSAFWDAFSGGNLKGDVDTDKVRRVLEGKAVVRVVDLDEEARRGARRELTIDALEDKMRSMSVASGDCAGAATGVFSNLRGKK